LKATSGWSGGNGTDEYEFSALPGGFGGSGGSFHYVGYDGYWWSATGNDIHARYRSMSYNYSDVNKGSNFSKSNLISVRCVRD
jgi:uncharacterized protein (TIGR02145 family)